MATDHTPQQGRRGGHFHRGRRGPDRRGLERRSPPAQDAAARPERGGDRVDVEQIMRDIRARISQRSGVELSNQQIQELAARRLEAILDPRGLKPALLDQLRRTAAERPVTPAADATTKPYSFVEADLYESPNALLRFFRKLLNPLLRLLFNPTPLAHTFALQAQLNAELAARELERERRQSEWNALHYEILQRVVTEISRVSIEAQNLSLRVESLSAKVDFNDRRVRGFEGTQARPATRPPDPVAPSQPAVAISAESPATPETGPTAEGQPSADAPRRRRRRRRGRRGTGASVQGEPSGTQPIAGGIESDSESEDEFEDEGTPAETAAAQEEPVDRQSAPEPPHDAAPQAEPAHRDDVIHPAEPGSDNPETPHEG